ncbi:hypothetical protein BJ322DRAFT_1113229 [Thelephora terrestris]|uniref:Uncharacterized protein n=1 Tax=Thelephora terrestris TaxID=56493 RepID=A0A9P6H4L2_9AGAM|nr:hypothetical protein BJ322DRAFT_1113229 [Thelephora terrestris]
MDSAGSPATEAHPVLSNRPSPATPTPSQKRRHDHMRIQSPLLTTEAASHEPSQFDRIFRELLTRLKLMTTLVSFKWDAEISEGILHPIPYPRDDKGNPVEPLQLPEFVKTNRWELPSCFCAVRGPSHQARLVVPTLRDFTSTGMMCMVCPNLQCPYFVNISELMNRYKDDVLAVENTAVTGNHPVPSDDDTATEAPAKKPKRNLRANRANGNRANRAIPASVPSQPPHIQLDDRPSAGLAVTTSNLFGKYGALPQQFFKVFRVCEGCGRIVCSETSRAGGHTCIIEIEDSD